MEGKVVVQTLGCTDRVTLSARFAGDKNQELTSGANPGEVMIIWNPTVLLGITTELNGSELTLA